MDNGEMSLKEFIEQNQALLSAMAIFATITALLGTLPIKWLSIALSFISITGMVVVWHEVKAQLPEKMSFKLFLFRYILLYGFGGLVFYWLLEFREIWHVFLFIPLTILFGYEITLTLKPIREWRIAKLIFGIGKEKNWVQKALYLITIFAIGWSSLYLAALFSIPLNSILDWIKNTFH